MPFLGITAPERRRLLKQAWAGMPTPTSEQLVEAAMSLMHLRQREYHDAVYDLIVRFGDD